MIAVGYPDETTLILFCYCLFSSFSLLETRALSGVFPPGVRVKGKDFSMSRTCKSLCGKAITIPACLNLRSISW